MSEALVALARRAQQQAYAPYSGFRVGAAVEAEDGTTFMGCNIENASYGLTICAERAAVAAAVTAGHRRIRRVAVVTDADPPSAPCGACRQVLSEFGPALTVIASGPRGERRWTMQELLPDAFGPEELT
ncbi:MAG TPA: cytidine deaminase [Gemmatimonadales bacterium]